MEYHHHIVSEHDGLRHDIERAALSLVCYYGLEQRRTVSVSALEVASDKHVLAALADVVQESVQHVAGDVQVGDAL